MGHKKFFTSENPEYIPSIEIIDNEDRTCQ